MHNRPSVVAAMVNFNGGALLTEAVCACLASTIPVHCRLADNGSTDGSIAALPSALTAEGKLTVIQNGKNLGFAKATNIALQNASSEYLLLLNPDCLIKPDTLERLLAVMADHPEAAMAGCLIRNPDGSEQRGCRRSIPTPWSALVDMLRLDKLLPWMRWQGFNSDHVPLLRQTTYVPAISGAFMLVRRDAAEQVGYLDEGYFLHCEDLDWCLRFTQAGWKILFVPHIEVIHHKGTCSRQQPLRVEWHKHKGMARFFRKFFRHRYSAGVSALVMIALWTRFLMKAALITLQSACKRGAQAR